MRELIQERLWIGNSRDVHDIRSVLARGITSVIDLAIDELPAVYPRDIIYCRFPLIDGGGNSPVVLHATIQTAITLVNGGVATLVACSLGMSRSPCIAAAILSNVEQIDADDALQRILLHEPHDVSANLWADIKLSMRRMTKPA